MSVRPPLRPALPLAKRLNRNALTVAAVLVGMTVLTAIVVVRPSREAHRTSAADPAIDEPQPAPLRPAFLDEPVRAPPPSDTPAMVGQGRTIGGRLVGQGPARPAGPPSGAPPAASVGDAWRALALAGVADTELQYPTVKSTHGSAASSLRQRAYRAALASPMVGTTAPTPESASGHAESPPLATEEERLLGLGDSVLRAAARSSGGSGASEGAAERAPLLSASPIAGGRHRAFLEQAGDAKGATVIARIEPAGSAFTLRAGTVIPGLLLTGINSDLPGDLVAQVSRDVYDSRTQRTLLIPKGARLIGTYDNRVVAGEGRLLVAWTRLILPDGRSMGLPGLALKDPQGATGAKDEVDTHWHRLFGNALLLSAISAGVQLSQPRATNVLTPPSAGQVAAGALGQELSSVALEVLRRGMDVAPTITIRQGQPFNVFLNGDLVFDGPYEEASPGER